MQTFRARPGPAHLRRRLVALAAAIGVSLALSPLSAQERSPDTSAPVIEIEVLGEAVADARQTFTAQVADDGQLASVTLHHRREGEGPFDRAPMREIGSSGYFGVSLPTDPADLAAIEYYVQALDDSGNRTVSGFAFDPLRRTLRPPSAVGAPETTPPPAAPAASSGRTRWWALALGVLAVGAIASLAGGEDGGGSGGGTVPLTIDLPEPAAR